MEGGNSNRRPVQGGAAGVNTDAATAGNWRSLVRPEARARIINKMTDTFQSSLQIYGQEVLLRDIAERLEERIFTTAMNQSDYIRKLAIKILVVTNIRNSGVNNQRPSNSTSQDPQIPGGNEDEEEPDESEETMGEEDEEMDESDEASAEEEYGEAPSRESDEEDEMVDDQPDRDQNTSAESGDPPELLAGGNLGGGVAGRHSVGDCSICLEPMVMAAVKEILWTPCAHAFHARCFRRWLRVRERCPLCRHRCFRR